LPASRPEFDFAKHEGKRMNTKTITDRAERKEVKRKARKAAEEKSPLQPREYARGEKKKKVKTMVRGQRKR
jgi:hypothetical protein